VHLTGGVPPYAAPLVEDAVDGGLAEAGLLGDLSDPEWVTDPDPPEGFLMVFCA
jgi:hypothetical protein